MSTGPSSGVAPPVGGEDLQSREAALAGSIRGSDTGLGTRQWGETENDVPVLLPVVSHVPDAELGRLSDLSLLEREALAARLAQDEKGMVTDAVAPRMRSRSRSRNA